MIEGAQILMLPGMDGTGQLFRWLVRALEPEARATVVSYPADRPLRCLELADVVFQQIPPRPFVIVAESYSGAVGLAVAARRPPGLRGLILSTAFVVSPLPGWVRFAPLRTLLRLRLPAPVLRRLLLDGRSCPEVVAEVGKCIRAVSPVVLARRLREVLSADARGLLSACAVPVVYLAAARDRLIGLRGLRAIQRIRPGVESVTLDGPHLLLQARPDEAAAVIRRYAQRWLSNRGDG